MPAVSNANSARKKRAKIAVALVVAVLLAIFGIGQLGGETWPAAVAEAYLVRAYVPQPPGPDYPPELVPITIVIALVLAGGLYCVLNRRARAKDRSL